MADELGSIGRLSVSVNVDTSGFTRGMAEVSAQMRAASAGMSSSMGKVESDVRSSTSRIGLDVDSVGRSTSKAASDVDRDTKKVSRSIGDVGTAAGDMSRLVSRGLAGVGSAFSGLGSLASRAGSVLVTGIGNALRGLGTVLPLVGDSIKGLGENLIKMQSAAGDAGEAAAGATADIAGMGPVGIAVAVAVIGLGVSLGVLAGALAAVGIAFVATAALITGVIGGFGALAAGVVLLAVKMGGAGNTASTAWTKLKGDFTSMADTLGKLVVGPATDILNWADSMIPKVQTLGAGIAKWFGQALPQVLSPTTATPSSAPGKGGQFMSGGPAQAAQPAFATTALDDLTKALQKLGGLFQQAFGYVIAHKAEFEQFFNQTLNGAVQVIKGLMQNLEKLSGWWFANWPRMAPTVEAVFSAMGYVIQAFIGLCEFLALVVQTVGSSIIFTIHDVGDIFSWLGSTASTVFNDIITTVQNAASAIGSAIGSMFSGAGTIAQQQLNAVIGVINAFISAVDNSPLGALGVNIGTISPIGVTGVGPGPKASTSTVAGFFAQGGIVPGAGGGDTFPAMLTPGEVVLNRGAVAGLGGAGAANALNQMGGNLGGLGAAIGSIGGQCVARGTLVAAEHGDVPIEDVQVGDRVWTRQGLKPVVRAELTRRNAEVLRIKAGDRELILTPDHKVWVERRADRAAVSCSLLKIAAAKFNITSRLAGRIEAPLTARIANDPDGDLSATVKAGSVGSLATSVTMHGRTRKTDSLPLSRLVNVDTEVFSFHRMASQAMGVETSPRTPALHVGAGRKHFRCLSPSMLRKPGPERVSKASDLVHLSDVPSVNRLGASGRAAFLMDRSALHDGEESVEQFEIGIGHSHPWVWAADSTESKMAFALENSGSPGDLGGTIELHRSDSFGVGGRDVPASPSPFLWNDHYHTDSRWVETQDLRIGDHLLLFDERALEFRPVAIESAEPAESVDTYDLTIDDAHEFVAGGVCVANCVEFVEAMEGVHFPVAFASQMTADINSQTPSVGEIFVSTIPPFGHTGIINGPNSVIDSNWVGPLLVGIHALSDIPDIAGYINLGKGLPAGVPMGQGAQTVKTNINSILAGIVSGLSLPSLTGFFGSLPKNLLEQVAEDVGNFAANKIGSVGSWVGNDLAAIGFDSGHNILPPGFSVAWNGTGKPEALSTQGKGGRGDVNVVVTAPVNNPGEFSRQLRRELGWAMRVAG